MKQHALIALTKKYTESMGLDENQARIFQYNISKDLPVIIAKQPDLLSHLLHQQAPRHDRIAEQGLIGRILLYPNIVLPECSGMSKEYFYLVEYAAVFEVCQTLSETNRAIGVDIVAALLGQDFLDEWGGKAWLQSITLGIKDTETSVSLRDRVAKAYKLRKAWQQANQFIEQSYKVDIEDADELISSYKSELDFDDGIKDTMACGFELSNIFDKDLDKTLDRIEKGIEFPGLMHPIHKVNQTIGGRQRGNLDVEAGRPGMGKTADAICEFNYAVFDLGEPSAYFSLEMPKLRLVKRMFFSRYRVNRQDYDNGLKTPELKGKYQKFQDELHASDAYIDDRPAITWRYVKDKCLKIQNELKLKGKKLGRVFIDYLQLMSAFKGNNREQEISIITRNLKALALELEIPVILLCQLNRSVETRGGSKRPQLSDLRGSGGIEQDADSVAFAYRPEYYDIFEDEEGNSLKGVLEKIYAKNREGALETIRCFFEAEYTRVAEYTEREFGYENDTHRSSQGESSDFNWSELKNDITSDQFIPDI